MSLREKALNAWEQIKRREERKVLKKVAKITSKWRVERLTISELRKDEAVIEIDGERVILNFRHKQIYAEPLPGEIVFAKIPGLSLEALGSLLEELNKRGENKK